MGTKNLDKIFNPRRVAVIGASNREGSVGYRLLKNLIGVGYTGVVYPVNPFRFTIQGMPAYPNISKIPRQIDLAIIATPAHTVPQIVEECGKAGVSGIVIISAGFKETGKEGEDLEKEILTLKNEYDMRIIGPSSFGVMRPQIKLNTTFAEKIALPGKIAFISQSAALCASVLDWASESYVGFSAVISTGSMLDVDLGDLIDYFGMDPQTRNIVLFVEFIKDARKFMSAARSFARAKPIVVVKAGRFNECRQAIFSHTGALIGEDAVYDAAFKRAGIVRVEAIHDLFNCAEALVMQPRPKGPNLTIVTNAGGPGIMAADSLIAKGGRLTPSSDDTIQALTNILPSYCSVMNPIDILEEASLDRFRKVMEICFKDTVSDGFLIIYTPQTAADPLAIAKTIVELSRQTTKPILTSMMGEGRCREARRILEKNRIPAFQTPEQAVSTFMYMYSYTRNLELLYQAPEELPVDFSVPIFLKKVLTEACNEGQSILYPPDSLQFLNAYKIPTIKTLLAKTPEEAKSIASKLGYPIVMKVLSPQITHKSKAGGVILNVWSPKKIKPLFDELTERIRCYNPEAEFQGAMIQPLIQKNEYELLIGSMSDPHFGPLITFGMGGVNTDLLKDVSIGFPPLNQILAKRLMEDTNVYKHLESKGFSTRPLEEILVKFSQLVIDFPEIKEMDINPIIVNENNAVAVDARIVIDPKKILPKTTSHEHLMIAPYPKKYITQFELKNGTPVVFCPIKPEDELLFNEMFESLSEKTLRLRFFQIIKNVSHQALTRYCNIDYDREIAIVAKLQNDRKDIIGIARLILEADGKKGECAVLVADQWQELGLGTKLFDYIIDIGKDKNLQTIYGYVVSNNAKMLHICKKRGFKIEPIDEEMKLATLDLSSSSLREKS